MGFLAQEHFCPACVHSVFGATNGMKVMVGGGMTVEVQAQNHFQNQI
jgi:hypothetical protein